MRIGPVVSVAFSCALMAACSAKGQDAREIYLGPGTVRTIELKSPNVLYRIGDKDGPGLLEQGGAFTIAPVPAGGFLVYTSYFSGGPVQHFRDGKVVRVFGRPGGGPGEYQRVGGLTVDARTGKVWVLDSGAARLVSFDPDGSSGEVVSIAIAGVFARSPLVLPDGSLLVNGPGGSQTNMGFLLHRYDPTEGTWSSYHPVLRDSAFSAAVDETWQRQLTVTADGDVIAVTEDYVIEVLNPRQEFAVEARIRRQPDSWPADVAADYARRFEEDQLARPYAVTDALADTDNRLWVLSVMPDRSWRQKVGRDPRRPWENRSLNAAPDAGLDTLIEVIDLSTFDVLASYRLDARVRYLAGRGMLAYYAGDLPYPQLEILEISLDKEAS